MDKAHRIAGSLAATAAGVLSRQSCGDMVKIDLSVRNAEGVINTKAIREVPIGMPPDAPAFRSARTCLRVSRKVSLSASTNPANLPLSRQRTASGYCLGTRIWHPAAIILNRLGRVNRV